MADESAPEPVRAYIQRCRYSLNGTVSFATTLHGMDTVEKASGKRMNHDAMCGFVAKT